MKTGLPKNFIDTSWLVKKREAAEEEETHLAANFIHRLTNEARFLNHNCPCHACDELNLFQDFT